MFFFGIFLGWFGNHLFEEKTRKSISVIDLYEANKALKNSDSNAAIEYAIRAFVLDPQSYLTSMLLA